MESLEKLFKETEEKFGLENASFLFDYVSQELPRRQYRTVRGLYFEMQSRIKGYENLRDEVRKIKELQDRNLQVY